MERAGRGAASEPGRHWHSCELAEASGFCASTSPGARLDPTGGHNGIQQEAIDHLDNYLDATLETDLPRMYRAHWTLTMLHWTIRAGETDVIDLHLRLGETTPELSLVAAITSSYG